MSDLLVSQGRDSKRWLVLLACTVATLMVTIDSGILNLVIPAIQAEFNPSQSSISLLSSISTLMLAAFILGGGTLGDLYGRRRFILIGTAGMLAMALLSMVAPSPGALIGLRALDGIFQAMVNPLVLAILTVTFEGEERPKALGIYGASLGVMGGLSSLVVQFFNQAMGWRSVFLLLIGLGLLTLALMLGFVSESRAQGRRQLDLVGILLCAAGLLGLVYGVSQASGPGGLFSGAVMIPALGGLGGLVAFILWESRVPFPALELSLFEKPAFSLGCLLVLLLSFGQTGAFFHLSNYFQVLLRQSPVQSALMLLPLTLSLFIFSIMAGPLVNRFSVRTLTVAGTATFALGLFLFSRLVQPDLSLWTVLLPMLLLGAGYSVANIPRMNALLSSAPPNLAGTASATNNAAVQLGNALGIAVTVALVTTFGRNYYLGELRDAGLTPEQISRVNDLLQRLLKSDLPSISAQFAVPVHQLQGLVGNYQAAFTTGVAQMFLVSAIALLLSAIVLWFGLRSEARPGSP